MRKSMGFLAGAAAIALAFSSVAIAQQKAPEPKKQVVKKAPSPCAGLDEAACKANTACTWYRETTTKKGQKRKAHCQKKPTPPAKKAPAAEKKK